MAEPQTTPDRPGPSTDLIGRVESVLAGAQVVRANGEIVQLEPGTELLEGDVVQTETGSRVAVQFADGTTINLGGNSSVLLKDINIDPTSGGGRYLVQVIKGITAFSLSDVASEAGGSLTVETPIATVHVRDADVAVDFTDTSKLTVIRLGEVSEQSGSVAVTNDTGVTLLAAGSQGTTIFDTASAPSNVVRFSPAAVQNLFGGVLATDDASEPSPGPAEVTEESAQSGPPQSDAGKPDFVTASGDDGSSQPDAAPPPPHIVVTRDEVDPAPEPGEVVDAVVPPPVTGSSAPAPAVFTEAEERRLDSEPEPEPNLAPTASDINILIKEDVSVSGAVLVYDADADDLACAVADGCGPEHGTLAFNPDGTYLYVPDRNFSGVDEFIYEADDGRGGVVTATVTIEVSPIADIPLLTVADAAGAEDTAIPLPFSASATDASETVSIQIIGVPDGASLSAGTDNGDGTWILTGGELDGLMITPPLDSSHPIVLEVYARSTEPSTGEAVEVVRIANVSVTPLADAPTLSVAHVTGVEDSEIPLNITAVSVDPSEALSVIVSGVPDGASLSAGIDNGDGCWTLRADDLDGLTMIPPAQMSGELHLTVTAASTETETGESAEIVGNLSVTISPVSDAPSLSVTNVAGTEDTQISLDISAVTVDPSEALSVTVSGVPEGANLSAGIDNGDGSWTLAPDELEGLTLTPPAHLSGELQLTITATSTETETGQEATTISNAFVAISPVSDAPSLIVTDVAGAEDTQISLDISAVTVDPSEALSVTISGVPDGASLSAGVDNGDGSWTLAPTELEGLTLTPPAHLTGELQLTITATSTETETGQEATTISNAFVAIEPVADQPDLVAADVVGGEDTEIPLSIASSLTDPSEILSVRISGVPDGANLSAGIDNGDGSWTLAADELEGLSLTPPPHSSDDIALEISATSIVPETGDAAEVVQNANVIINAIADMPSIFVEDAEIAGGGAPTDDKVTGTNAADILVGGGGADVIKAKSGDDILYGDEGPAAGWPATVDLEIEAALSDVDGSEQLAIIVSGLPDDATLSAGVPGSDGAWILAPSDLPDLQLILQTDPGETLQLQIDAHATDVDADSGISDTAIVSRSLEVSTAEVAAGDDVLRAGSGDDLVYGGGGADKLYGESGDDVLYGESGDDLLKGGGGDDELRGGTGDDRMFGDSGDDALHGDAGDDLMKGGRGEDEIFGGSGDDAIFGDAGDDVLHGDTGDDVIKGGSGDDLIFGGAGEDDMKGDSGDDYLAGGAGGDTLSGGSGADTLIGGEGDDVLTGGSGADTFVFNVSEDFSSDTITDFKSGDTIVFEGSEFTPDDITFVQDGKDTLVVIGGQEMELQLDKVSADKLVSYSVTERPDSDIVICFEDDYSGS